MVIAFIFIIILFKACDAALNGDDKKEKSKVGDVGSGASDEKESGGAQESAGIGQYIEGLDLKISLLDAKLMSSIPSGSEYISYVAPDDGKIFMVLSFEFENISDKNDYINPLYFEAYEDGYGVDSSTVFTLLNEYNTISGNIAAGKKLKGCLIYEVNKSWKEFEICYDSFPFDKKKGTGFRFTPDDID